MISDDLRRQADVFIDLKSLQGEIGRSTGNRNTRNQHDDDDGYDDDDYGEDD